MFGDGGAPSKGAGGLAPTTGSLACGAPLEPLPRTPSVTGPRDTAPVPSALELLCLALALVNLFAFGQCGWDKLAAIRGWRRVPEKRLIAPVWAGGLPGLLLGMKLFRHKTSKASFQGKLAWAAGLWLALIAGAVGLWFYLG